MHIFHSCADCYIKVNGHKIYLDELARDVKAKLDSGKTFITLRKSTITGYDMITVKASDITFIKECN